MPFVVNEPVSSRDGTQTMNHQHPPGHDCSKCTKPTCPSNILPPMEPLVNTRREQPQCDYLPPPEPVLNVGRSDEQSTPAVQDDLRHPSRVFLNDGEQPLMPAPALIDERYDGGTLALKASDGGNHDVFGSQPAH